MKVTIEIRGKSDRKLQKVQESLRAYTQQHDRAEIAIYRQNPVSIRIRVIDPDFQGTTKSDRHDELWRYLEPLPDELLQDISVLLLLTPAEARKSFLSQEFEEPTPSRL